MKTLLNYARFYTSTPFIKIYLLAFAAFVFALILLSIALLAFDPSAANSAHWGYME